MRLARQRRVARHVDRLRRLLDPRQARRHRAAGQAELLTSAPANCTGCCGRSRLTEPSPSRPRIRRRSRGSIRFSGGASSRSNRVGRSAATAVDEPVGADPDQAKPGDAVGLAGQQRRGGAKEGLGQLGRVGEAARARAQAKIGGLELQRDGAGGERRSASGGPRPRSHSGQRASRQRRRVGFVAGQGGLGRDRARPAVGIDCAVVLAARELRQARPSRP